VWAAKDHIGSRSVLEVEIDAGHIGTFMSHAALHDHWPGILAWILQREA
jgi:hypothetical protein